MKWKTAKLAAVLLLMLFIGSAIGSTYQVNADQSQIYHNALMPRNQAAVSDHNQTSLYQMANISVSLDVIVHYTTSHGLSPDPSMLAEGYVPNCVSLCIFGINYAMDPTVLITNNGHDFEQCKIFGAAGTITCTSADIAQYLSVSVSSSYTPLAGDSACHATVQTADGYSVIAGTITAGAAGTTVTTTITHTWTDTTASVSNIDLACIQTEASGGGNVVLYAEGQIASTSTNVGDSLQTVWTIART